MHNPDYATNLEFKDGGIFQFQKSKFDLYDNEFHYQWDRTKNLPRKAKKRERKRLIEEDVKKIIKEYYIKLYTNASDI